MMPRVRFPLPSRFLCLFLFLAGAVPAYGQNYAVDRHFELRPGGRVMYVSLDTVDTPTIFSGTPFQVHRALVEVYKELKIPLVIQDSLRGQVGHSGLPLKRIDGKRMSHYVGCGHGMTGPYADIHRVTVALVSWAYPQGRDSTAVRTGVFAGAVDVAEGSSSLPRPCLTTGMFEERVRMLLREKLRTP
jgi:hypothetical protein